MDYLFLSGDDEISVVGFDILDTTIAYLSKKYPSNLYLHASIGLKLIRFNFRIRS